MKISVIINVSPDDHLSKSERNKSVYQSYVVDDLMLRSMPEPTRIMQGVLRELTDNVRLQADQYIVETLKE